MLDQHLAYWEASQPLEPIVLAHPMQNISGVALDTRATALVSAILARLP